MNSLYCRNRTFSFQFCSTICLTVIALAMIGVEPAHAKPFDAKKEISSLKKKITNLSKKLDKVGVASQIPGIKGDTGAQGVQGAKGEAGVPGLNGESGEKGITGDVGPVGIQGPAGVQGPLGPEGFLKTVLPDENAPASYLLPNRNGFDFQIFASETKIFPDGDTGMAKNTSVVLSLAMEVNSGNAYDRSYNVRVEICPTLLDCGADYNDAVHNNRKLVAKLSAAVPLENVGRSYTIPASASFIVPNGWFYRVFKFKAGLSAQGFPDNQKVSVDTIYYNLE